MSMKMLIIEDEEASASVLEEKFAKEKYEIKVARDGESGMSYVKSFHPDIVLLDLVIPKKNGFEVLEEIKTNKATESIPVVVLSNLSEDSDIKKCLALGASDYFAKSQHPINEVVEKVKGVLLRGK